MQPRCSRDFQIIYIYNISIHPPENYNPLVKYVLQHQTNYQSDYHEQEAPLKQIFKHKATKTRFLPSCALTSLYYMNVLLLKQNFLLFEETQPNNTNDSHYLVQNVLN